MNKPATTDVTITFTRDQFDDLVSFLRDCSTGYREDGEDDAAEKLDAYVAVFVTAKDSP